jgi:hypothetical protein
MHPECKSDKNVEICYGGTPYEKNCRPRTPRDRFVDDSPLEGTVTSEPVSENRSHSGGILDDNKPILAPKMA